jgi:hypothetical protein
MTRGLDRALSRLGRQVPVYEESDSGTDDSFGQSELTWSQTGTVLAARSYQNRNTTQNNSGGQLHRDRPMFFFPAGGAPPADARIKYDGNWYELDAPTPHDTHAVAPGSQVLDENFPP